eukprot:6684513-Prymnesium_polylepis.1
MRRRTLSSPPIRTWPARLAWTVRSASDLAASAQAASVRHTAAGASTDHPSPRPIRRCSSRRSASAASTARPAPSTMRWLQRASNGDAAQSAAVLPDAAASSGVATSSASCTRQGWAGLTLSASATTGS